jgi:uncharacterized protein YdaT
MSFLQSSNTQDEGKIVEKQIVPVPVPDPLAQQQAQATIAWHIQLWRWLKNYSADDIERLKEAGVGRVEAETDVKAAEAMQRMSEAQKNFAEKERIAQEAALKKAEFVKTMAEADKISAEATEIRMRTVMKALQDLTSAVSTIRQNGGEVFFDLKQLEKIIVDSARANPRNLELKDVREEIEGE